MKLNIKILVFTTAAAAWAMAGFAQVREGGTSLKERFEKDGRVLEYFLKNPDESPETLRAMVVRLRQSQVSLRDSWIQEYRPGDGATVAEIRAAREEFQSEFADEIRASKELRASLVRELRQRGRDATDDSAWNEEAREIYAQYNQVQSELSAAWRAVRAELGQDATRGEIAAAKERFNEANADLIANQKELALQVRQLIRENREERVLARDELPQEMQDLRRDMAALRQQVRNRQRQARADMKNLNKENREAYRQDLLEDLKDLHDEIKERRRQVIDELRDDQNGDRRPEG